MCGVEPHAPPCGVHQISNLAPLPFGQSSITGGKTSSPTIWPKPCTAFEAAYPPGCVLPYWRKATESNSLAEARHGIQNRLPPWVPPSKLGARPGFRTQRKARMKRPTPPRGTAWPSRRQESNLLPSVYKTAALPHELLRHYFLVRFFSKNLTTNYFE
jgi:hypothetical protein